MSQYTRKLYAIVKDPKEDETSYLIGRLLPHYKIVFRSCEEITTGTTVFVTTGYEYAEEILQEVKKDYPNADIVLFIN